MAVLFVEGHEFTAGHFLGLVQGDEVNVVWWESFVAERALDGVEIVCAD